MTQPVLATPVVEEPQSAALSRFSALERHYLRGMKRRDRTGLVRIVDADLKRARSGGGPCAVAPLRIQVLQSGLPDAVNMKIFEDLRTCHSDKYLQWVRRAIQLPLGRLATPTTVYPRAIDAVRAARAHMDSVATGFGAVKTEVLKLVCQQALGAPCASGYSLGLHGPPGTGNTHFARNAIAAALQRPMIEIPLGGATDISYLLGILYSYEGSREGRLASGLIEAGCCNPVVFLDEVCKISDTDRGRELAAVLIHLIDPTSNTHLRDRYFHGVDLDFSRCTFVFSFNDPERINPILLDRIKTFDVPRPTREERRAILADHIVPRVARRLGASAPALSDDAVDYLAEVSERRDTGMRGIENDVDGILSLAQLESVTSEATARPPCPRTLRAAWSRRRRRRARRPRARGMYT